MAVRVAEMERRGVPSSAPVILPSVLSEREAAPALPQLLPTAVVDDSAESAINMEVDLYLSSSEEEVRSWRQPHSGGAEDISFAEEAPKRNNAGTFSSFSQSLYTMENIDRDAMLLRENVVTRSGRAMICPTRLNLSHPVMGSIEK